MSLGTVCVYPSFTTQAAMLFLISYPFLLWVLSTYRNAPMTASALPAALAPLFVAAAASWMEIASLLEALSLTGAGRVVRAAGVSGTLRMMTFGGGVAAFVCIVSGVRDWMRTKAQPASPPSPTSRALSMSMVSILAIVVGALFSVTRHIVDGGGVATPLALAFAAIAGAGGALSLGWLVLGGRRPALQLDQRRRAITAAAAVGAALIAYAAWEFATIYQHIAVRG